MATEELKEAMDYLNEYAGNGLDELNNAKAMAYLSLVQPGSVGDEKEGDAGTWRNSATGTNFGSEVRVIPIAFHVIWSERQNVAPYATVARYIPHSIEVETRMPPKGQRGYPKMFNPTTGYEVQELYVYAVILPDYPEEGVLFFNPTVGSMRACKSWNTHITAQRLPNGKPAPVFAFSWKLQAELQPNPQSPKELIAKFVRAVKVELTPKALFMDVVKPAIATASTLLLTDATED